MGIDQQSAAAFAPMLNGTARVASAWCGRFNDTITLRLLDGAVRGLQSMGVAEADVAVEWVPGAFEVPFSRRGR